MQTTLSLAEVHLEGWVLGLPSW